MSLPTFQRSVLPPSSGRSAFNLFALSSANAETELKPEIKTEIMVTCWLVGPFAHLRSGRNNQSVK
jgi:hypothetical protein